MSADSPHDPRKRRAVPSRDAPTLSLVLTSQGDPAKLESLLAGLLAECAAAGVEVVVVRAGPVDEARSPAREHPAVRWVRPGKDTAPDALRSAGMAAATGDVVMLASDDDPDAPARLRHLLRLYARPLPGAGAAPHDTPPSGPEPGSTGPADRRDDTPTDAAEDTPWHPRSRLADGWTGSPRATASSSSAPAPAA
ncbi:MAG TPA: glycosyltransferase [Longimicrobiaceae bacterium]|nr:glycosyltransferase [Longimicrobiaceae bacterium]